MKEIVERLHEKRQIELAKSILESKGYIVSKKVNESEHDDARKEYHRRVSRYQNPNDPIGYPDFDDKEYERQKSEGEERKKAFIAKRRKEEGAPEDYEYNGVLDKFIKKSPDNKNFKIWESNLSESKEIDNTFNVGDIVTFSMLYGGNVTAEVVDRKEDKLTLREYWIAEDTGEEASDDTDYSINKDDKGVEYIVTWEYHGHEGVVYPPNSEYSE